MPKPQNIFDDNKILTSEADIQEESSSWNWSVVDTGTAVVVVEVSSASLSVGTPKTPSISFLAWSSSGEGESLSMVYVPASLTSSCVKEDLQNGLSGSGKLFKSHWYRILIDSLGFNKLLQSKIKNFS